MDNAEQIFERIRQEGSDWLLGQPEGPFLDFKRKEHPSIAGAERKDRQTYSEMLSAFSNTGGGVIVWGQIVGRMQTVKMSVLDLSQFPI